MPSFAANLSMLFTEFAWLDRFAAARDAGFRAVEIQFPYELPRDELARTIERAGVELALFNVPAGDLLAGGDGLACVPGREGVFREALELACDYAAALKPRCVNVLAGRVPEGTSRARCLGLLDGHLALASERLAALSVTTTVEALNGHDVPRFLLQTHDEVIAAIESAAQLGAPSATVQYDVYHQLRMGRDVLADLSGAASAPERRSTRAPRIGHIQFADVPGRGAPGTGHVDFQRVFDAIDASWYDGYVGAEYRPTGATRDSLGWLSAYL
jgi:hydroxypyruvate isomerase